MPQGCVGTPCPAELLQPLTLEDLLLLNLTADPLVWSSA